MMGRAEGVRRGAIHRGAMTGNVCIGSRPQSASKSVLVGEIFFFFQAEDGIRDLTVTGVQTCALPISMTSDAYTDLQHKLSGFCEHIITFDLPESLPVIQLSPPQPEPTLHQPSQPSEIGRASCRERV